MNFEEVRALSFLMIPLMYFALQGLDTLWLGGPSLPSKRGWALAALLLLVVQPIHVVRLAPKAARERVFTLAQSLHWLDQGTSLRNAYARQFLRLDQSTDGLYYAVEPVYTWLKEHTVAGDRVLTNRDDLLQLPAIVLGTSNGFLNTSSASLRRLAWNMIRTRLNEAIAQRDLDAVLQLGKECHARFAVVPWSVEASLFGANGFSVVAVNPPTAGSTAPLSN